MLAYFIYRKRRPPTPPPEPQLFAVDAALLRPTTPDQDDVCGEGLVAGVAFSSVALAESSEPNSGGT